MNEGERSVHSLAVVRCAGPDTDSFLQGQLTSDLGRLDGATQLAACATPQGRVIAILHVRRRDDGIYLLLPAALAATVADRLRKFVLRAKVRIEALDGWSITGLHRATDRTAIDTSQAESPPPVVFEYADGRVALARQSAAGPAQPEIDEAWRAADIAAGLPQLTPETSAHFVPQMLNLDLLDAISFTKGCYTGQEIVARTQHLGRIKRRTFRYAVRVDEALAPLTGLNLDATKVGEVLMSARGPGGTELLAVVSLDARDRPLRTATGHTAIPLPLPYAV